jgi:L-histidine N-alpha-methyltransferase
VTPASGMPWFVEDEVEAARFAADVREHLARSPRQLPSRYFYDPLGSALFDAICHLPWYPITRAESRLLQTWSPELHRRLGRVSTIVELGPGNGEKLKLLLERGGWNRTPLEVHFVDVSSRALETAARTLASLERVRVVAHAAEYDAGLRDVASAARGDGPALVLFLGSNIGNFDPAQAEHLLAAIRESLSEGDALLLGTDLIKREADLLLAYDDPLGVTAAFNRNLLVRINRELGGTFAVEQFAHRASWNRAHSRMEMYLVARSRQHLRIGALPMEFTMEAGERIWTESSYKYRPDAVSDMLARASFRTTAQWIDGRDPFALTLAQAM